MVKMRRPCLGIVTWCPVAFRSIKRTTEIESVPLWAPWKLLIKPFIAREEEMDGKKAFWFSEEGSADTVVKGGDVVDAGEWCPV